MELLYLIILILTLYGISKLFSYLKNQEVSRPRTGNSVNVTTSFNDIENQPRRKFEREVAGCFENRGFTTNLGTGKNDNGIDIVVTKGLETYLVQCKHYYGMKWVTANEVRDFYGAVKYYKETHNTAVKGGIFITSGKISSKAKETARVLNIELWGKYNRRDKINSL